MSPYGSCCSVRTKSWDVVTAQRGHCLHGRSGGTAYRHRMLRRQHQNGHVRRPNTDSTQSPKPHLVNRLARIVINQARCWHMAAHHRLGRTGARPASVSGCRKASAGSKTAECRSGLPPPPAHSGAHGRSCHRTTRFGPRNVPIGAETVCSALRAIRELRLCISSPGFPTTAKSRMQEAAHVMTATVFLFIDSSMASCVSCAVSSSSWNCVSPACALPLSRQP